MTGGATGAALFGKLPAHGDFIARGFKPAERDAMDDWIAGSIADARLAKGDAFEGMFDIAPPWRFARQGDDGWTVGAIAPSVDGVGRRYPILAQRRVADGDGVSATAAHCESAIYDAFEQGWDADALHRAIALPPPANDDDWPEAAGWWTMGGDDFDPATLDGETPAVLVRAMLTMREGGGEAAVGESPLEAEVGGDAEEGAG